MKKASSLRHSIMLFFLLSNMLLFLALWLYLYLSALETKLMVEMLIVYLFIFSISLFSLWTYLNKLLYPLKCLVNFCKDRSNDSLMIPVCKGSFEVNEIKDAIISLLDDNQNLCDQKQDIFKEAAHEIKSPIAVLKARISLFKQGDDYDKDLFIQESEEDIIRISNKLKELLFLKEIEWEMQQSRESVSMQDQCAQMQQFFRPILEKKDLQIISNFEDDFILTVHLGAMQKVMQAIFENIFMHTKNSSTIKTYINPEIDELSIVNEIGNNSDETLFSSHLGTKMIRRLSDKLDYHYETLEKDGYFTTKIRFKVLERAECKI